MRVAELRAIELRARVGLPGPVDLRLTGSTAILGPNGAGKSTLLRLLAGLAAPVGGRVEIDGTAVHALPPRDRARRIAYVPQNARLPAGFTVEALVAQGRFAHGHDADGAVEAALAAADLHALRSRRVETLSGGEAQRVLLARAFAQQAGWLLLDEPLAHLDLAQRHAVLGVIRRAAVPVVAVLHDLQRALAFERWVLMADGQVLAHDSQAALCTPAQLSATFGVPITVWQGSDGPVIGSRDP